MMSPQSTLFWSSLGALAFSLSACTLVTDEQWEAARDRDGDSFEAVELGGDDCDDDDAEVNPVAAASGADVWC